MTIKSYEIALIVPVFNEESIIARAISSIEKILANRFNSYIIVCVDDGSEDKTWNVLEDIIKKNTYLKGVKLSKNFGHDAALFAGLECVEAEAYITLDCDGEHPFDLIPLMYDRWRLEGCDVINMVKGQRRSEGLLYRLGVKAANKIVGDDLGVDIANATEFKLLSHRARDTLLSLRDTHVYYRGLVSWMGLPQINMTYDAVEGFRSGSRWSLSNLVQFAVSGMVLFSNFPIRLLIWLGLGVFAVCIVLALKLFYSMVFGLVPDGYATLLLLILINLAITMIGLGGLGIYISAILRQTLGRPRAIVEKLLVNDREKQKR